MNLNIEKPYRVQLNKDQAGKECWMQKKGLSVKRWDKFL